MIQVISLQEGKYGRHSQISKNKEVGSSIYNLGRVR